MRRLRGKREAAAVLSPSLLKMKRLLIVSCENGWVVDEVTQPDNCGVSTAHGRRWAYETVEALQKAFPEMLRGAAEQQLAKEETARLRGMANRFTNGAP